MVDGEMRWSAVNSDTGWDLYGERMSLELYKSMLGKIKNNEPPPEQFAQYIVSDYWQGGMPYLSIAHYPDCNGKAVPGEPKALYIDGEQLKAKGKLFDTPLGHAVWKSLKEDENKPVEDNNRIRISIAFLDLAHKHGETGQVFSRKSLEDVCPECRLKVGERIYVDGYLVHLALTTVPVNPRTIMEAENVMAKRAKPTTKKEDALSIVGDESLVEEITKSALETRSDILVEMSDAEPEEAPVTEPETSEEVVEAKSYGEVEQVQIWKPYGGATSMKEAKAYSEAQQESWRVSDLYYTFTSVASNIMDSEDVSDKAGALSTLVDEFKKGLVSKALYEEMSQIREGKLEENYMTIKKSELEDVLQVAVEKAMAKDKKPVEDGTSSTDTSEDEKEKKVEKKSDTVSEPVQKSALEVSVDNLYNSVNDVIGRAGTAEDKLKVVQPLLEEVGNRIVAVVRSSVGEVPATPTPVNDAVLEAIQSLSQSVQEMGTELATLKAQSANVNAPVAPRVPVPRSISPLAVKSEIPSTTPENPNSVKSIVRRSVGL